jgi:hypothetical protein
METPALKFEHHHLGIYKLTIWVEGVPYTALVSDRNIKSALFRYEDLGAIMKGAALYEKTVKRFNLRIDCFPRQLRAMLMIEAEAADCESKTETYIIRMAAESEHMKAADEIEMVEHKIRQLNNVCEYIIGAHQRHPGKLTHEKVVLLSGRVEKIRGRLSERFRTQTRIKEECERTSTKTPPLPLED